METVCIDKIVILCKASNGLNDSLNHRTYVIKCYKVKNYYYQLKYELVDGTHLLLCKITGSLRITFNPEKCIPENIKDILSYCQEIKISRLDIAVDYKEDLSRYIWIEKSGKRKIVSLHDKKNGKLSTIYFGKQKSQTTFIIYNKALQMKTTGIWWRVEARVRYPNIKNILPDNIFEPIFAGGTEKFPPKDSHLSRLKRHPEHIMKLVPIRRKKARRLTMASKDKLALQPSEVYNSFRSEMFVSLSRYIIIPPTEQNYTEIDTFDISNDLISYIYFVHKR